ncbi:MAG: hypothetical protein L0287_25350, partial [Anaerolineae bacterium]|nr:hypothetical protein [Anaerolineae bacterium]
MILDAAIAHISAVPYAVTARWVFYRLLQDGILRTKADYKNFLSYASKARKGFYDGIWTPWLLADDTRAAIIRGGGFKSESDWIGYLIKNLECSIDAWQTQPRYVEVWFEAAAMQSQFDYYCHPIIPLLAFHGDVSIPEKWKSAKRLFDRWRADPKPMFVYYFGDLDAKGVQIPRSAFKDIADFILADAAIKRLDECESQEIAVREAIEQFMTFREDVKFIRVGLLPEHVTRYDI